MKNLLICLLFFMTISSGFAQKTDAEVANKYLYAFLFVDREYKLTVHYENGNDEILATLHKNNVGGNITKENIVKGFDYYTKGFHHLENKGYEFVTTNHIPSQFGSDENPYFVFRILVKKD